jgi:hypothetical protein
MKIRINYVSNSSSSSFIIWGENASSFIFDIEDGYETNLEDVVYYIWNKKIQRYYNDKNEEINFVPDEEWINKLNNDENIHFTLPLSLREEAYYSDFIKDYKIIFENWFYDKFHKETFYFIDFSDHDNETKYHENDLWDVMNNYHGKGIYIFNH